MNSMKKSNRPGGGNRKLDTTQASGQAGVERLSPNGISNMEGNHNSSGGSLLGGDKRKPVTPDEASLTAKNYRLAKELSELRVRHRDETKNVTRLTMEHMNLSSRYREAVNTITVLKKELSIHQKTSSDLVALHKQYVEKYGIPISEFNMGSLSSTNLDMSENDHSSSPSTYRSTTGHHSSTTTEQAPKLQLHISPTSSATGNKDIPMPTSNGSASNKVSTNSMNNPQQTLRVKPSRSYEENINRTTKDPVAPAITATTTATTAISTTTTKELDKSWSAGGKGSTFRDKKSEHLENAFGDLYSNQFFTQNFKSSLSTTPEQNITSMDSEMKFEDYLFKTKTPTNVDAFEASFNTSFPTSFSPKGMMTSSSSMDLAFDVPGFSDPFYLASSPGSNNSTNTMKTNNTNYTSSGRVSSQQEAASTAANNSTIYNPSSAKLTIPYIDSAAAKRKSLDKPSITSVSATSSFEMVMDKRSHDLFPSSALNMFESLSANENSSKSQRGRSLASKDLNSKGLLSQESSTSSSSNQPPPPPPAMSPQIIDSKINVAASRARFDVVKSIRNDTVDPASERMARTYEISPTRADQRTHSSSSRRTYNKRGESDVSDEIGRLDEIVANASISPTHKETDSNMDSISNGQRSRRSVRQPVSYTEPSLNSKMRKGDVFFQKQEDDIEPSQIRISAKVTK